ncbi:hypothetical protein CVV38_01910 [Candidatus Peregrinibacteria bacterium HGW-Peregrinibacteria-1]|jgi:cytoskeletal protein RodZ|nr:MAG: hypothetical protein CVV38_01910 [Candidatus Peregrinibacteria bacterium HGW-Peregrinibacteria-1]
MSKNKNLGEYFGIVIAILLALGFIIVQVLSGIIFGSETSVDNYTYPTSLEGIELMSPGGAVPTHPPFLMTPTYAPPEVLIDG